MIHLIYQCISRNRVWIDHRPPFSKRFKGNKIFGRIPEEGYLEFSRIDFREVWFNRIRSEQVSKENDATSFDRSGTSLQLSCGHATTCLTLKIRLLDPILLN